jgi:hypothetical protein
VPPIEKNRNNKPCVVNKASAVWQLIHLTSKTGAFQVSPYKNQMAIIEILNKALAFYQPIEGILTKGEGSVHLTPSLRLL